MKVRKRPVEVEAWPVRTLNAWAEQDWKGLPQSVRDDYENPQGDGGWVFGALVDGRRGIYVPTLEGNLFAAPDDYIIKGVAGEFYPCKPDIFAQTYESAGPAEIGSLPLRQWAGYRLDDEA